MKHLAVRYIEEPREIPELAPSTVSTFFVLACLFEILRVLLNHQGSVANYYVFRIPSKDFSRLQKRNKEHPSRDKVHSSIIFP